MNDFCTYFPYLVSLATGMIGFLIGWVIHKNKVTRLNNEMYNRRRVYLQQKGELEKQTKDHEKLKKGYDELSAESERLRKAGKQLETEYATFRKQIKESGESENEEFDKLKVEHKFLQNRYREIEKKSRSLEAEKFKLNTKVEQIKLEIKLERNRLEKELREQKERKEIASNQPLQKPEPQLLNSRILDSADMIIDEPKETNSKELEQERLKALSKKIKSTLRNGKGEHRQDRLIPKEQFLPEEKKKKRKLKKIKKSYTRSCEKFNKLKLEYLAVKQDESLNEMHKPLLKALRKASNKRKIKKAVYKAARSYFEV